MPRDPRRIHAGDEAISAANWRDLVTAAKLINSFSVGTDMTAWKTPGGGLSIKNTGPLPPLPHRLNRRGSARILLTSGPYMEDGTNLDLKDLSVSEPGGFTANSSYLVGYRSVFGSSGVLTEVKTSTNILPYTETSGDNPLFRLGRIKTGGTPVSIIQVFQDWQGGTIERGETPSITPDADSPNSADALFLSTINYRPVSDDHEGELQLYGVRNVHEDNYGIPFIQPSDTSGGMRWLTPDSDRWFGASPVGTSAGRVKSIAKRRSVSSSVASLEIWGFYDHVDSGDLSTTDDFRLLARHPTGLNAQSTSGEVIYPNRDQVARWLGSSIGGITPDANSPVPGSSIWLRTINYRPVADDHQGELQLYRAQVVPIGEYGIPFLRSNSSEGFLDWLVPDSDSLGDNNGDYRSLLRRGGVSSSRPALEIFQFQAAPNPGAMDTSTDFRVIMREPNNVPGANVIYPGRETFADWIEGALSVSGSQLINTSVISSSIIHRDLRFNLTTSGIAGFNRDHNKIYWASYNDGSYVSTLPMRTTAEVRVGTLALNAQPASLWNPTAFTVLNSGTASITTGIASIISSGATSIAAVTTFGATAQGNAFVASATAVATLSGFTRAEMDSPNDLKFTLGGVVNINSDTGVNDPSGGLTHGWVTNRGDLFSSSIFVQKVIDLIEMHGA